MIYRQAISVLGAFALSLPLTLLPTTSHCHSLYVQSSRYQVKAGKRSPMFFCYGHHLPVDDGVRANKLKSVTVRTPSGKVLSIAPHPETGLQSHMVSYEKPGTYVLSAETNPGFYTVYLDKKGRKRHAVKPKSDIMDKAQKVTKSLLSKQFSKTYVVCGAPSAEFPARIGQRLELVPTCDITKLKAGGTLELEVFFNGEPYQGSGTWDASYNGFSTEAEDNFYPKTEIEGSTLKIFIPRPGRWFVRYYIKTPARGADKERCNKLKNTATLVFQIDNERKRSKSSSH